MFSGIRMLGIEHLLARSAVGLDARNANALERRAIRAAHEFGLEGDNLPLVRRAVRRARRLRVGDVLCDDVQPGLLRIERARDDVDAGDEVHALKEGLRGQLRRGAFRRDRKSRAEAA